MSREFKTAAAILVATTLIFMAVATFLVSLFIYNEEQPITKLNKGWTLDAEDGSRAENVVPSSLSTHLSRDLNRGERISLSIKLPKKADTYHSPTLSFRTSYCAVEVSVDGNKVYSFSMDRMKQGKFVGSKDHYIAIPDNAEGVEFKIDFYMSENDLRPDFVAPNLGNYMDLQYAFLHHYIYPLLCGLFLVIFGLFFLIISIILSPALPEVVGQLISSIISLVFGVWILTTFLIAPVFFNTGHTSDIEYVCFYSFVPLMYLLFSHIHRIKRRKLYGALSIVSSVLIAMMIALHFTDTVHMSETRPLYFALAIIMMLTLLSYDVADIKDQKLDLITSIQMIGPTLFCLFGFGAMVYYMIMGFFYHKTPTDSMLMLFTTGCMLFSLSRFLIYFMLLAETDPRRLEFRSLSRTAYMDSLTRTFNRNYYDETLARLDSMHDPFAILSMDLNGLKLVNDQMGHGAGDSLLAAFGTVIQNATPEKATCFRIGGDEFIILLPYGKRGELEAIVKKIKAELEELNKKEPDIPHSAAYGIAYSDEIQGATAQQVFMLADERMYENKRLQKESAS